MSPAPLKMKKDLNRKGIRLNDRNANATLLNSHNFKDHNYYIPAFTQLTNIAFAKVSIFWVAVNFKVMRLAIVLALAFVPVRSEIVDFLVHQRPVVVILDSGNIRSSSTTTRL